jgi:hypothetical protein
LTALLPDGKGIRNVQSRYGYPGCGFGPHDGHNTPPRKDPEMNVRPDIVLVHGAFAFDPVRAKVMYAVQQPLATFGDVMGAPAWKTRPSWYLVATEDQALPPAAQRQFAARMGATTVETPSSHVPMVSHPGDVAQLIETAAEAVQAASETGSPARGMTMPSM